MTSDKPPKPKLKTPGGRYSYEGLDRILHEKARLGLMTCLAGANEGLTFGELKKLCDLTDGNLNRHLKHLADADLVTLEKETVSRRPQTTCYLTDVGRTRFLDYLAELQRVIGDARSRLQHNQNDLPISTTRLTNQ